MTMWKLFDNFYVRRVASFFIAIVDVRYWCGEGYNSKTLDKALWKLLNSETFNATIGEYTAIIEGKEFWIENYPYTCGYVYGIKGFYPTLITRYRLISKVTEYKKKQLIGVLNDYFNQ